MIITGYTKIDTVTVPDWYTSVIHVSEEGTALDPEEIRADLEKDKESLDYISITSDTDPLDHPDLYNVIKGIKPRGMRVLLTTDGRDPAVLDDLVGAGYAHAANLLIGDSMTEGQIQCVEILKDNGCRFAITLDPTEHSEDSVRTLAGQVKGCAMIIFKQDRKRPLSKKEMEPLIRSARTCTWNVKVI